MVGVVVSGEKKIEEVGWGTLEEKSEMKEEKDDGSAEVVRWEKFLPRVVLRVLLVEADDSTRQIIAALLRKCSYRVAAVADGLKAWQTLKRKAHDIDLILTEVELPSISGFALLTLIMEHDICKKIPVIMMSSHDSISMVLKCMLKGAADFLIKPVRRNELRNLWQHVWRRHDISRHPQTLTFPQKKFGATSENDATSNHSSGSVASTQKNNECSEKGSEAQSTCTSPFLEAESAYMRNMQGTSQPKSSSNLSNVDTVVHEESMKFGRESVKHTDGTGEMSIAFVSEAARCNKTLNSTGLRLEERQICTETEDHAEVLGAELRRGNSNINTQIHGCSNELVQSYRGAIDLIATFDSLPKKTDENCSLNGGTNKFDFDPQLELSLRRDLPGSICQQATEERHTLNHSNLSAFSWYNNGCKSLQPLFPAPSFGSAKVNNSEWNSHESNKLPGNDVDTSCQYAGTNHMQENMTTLVTGHSGQAEQQLLNSQLGSFPATPATSDHKSSGYSNVCPSMFYKQSGVHLMWSPKPLCQKESSPFPTSTSFQSNPESHNSEQRYPWSDDATYTYLDQTVYDKSSLDPARHDSPAAGQNTSNNLYLDTANRIDNRAYASLDSGSDGNATSAALVVNVPESFSDSDHHNYEGLKGTDSHRSCQRQAALTKFRMKRKDRCYEKKVRYQSRKRLAEQRPRVKGQFVRLVNNDHPVADASGSS